MALQWLSLVGTIWLQSISATNSNFPAYSSQLKLLLSLSQLQLNNLAFASDAGKIFGFVSGIAAVYLPLWVVLLIGSTLGFIGYGVQYLFLLADQASTLPYYLVFLLTVLAGNSICWINTVCYVIAIQNFPFDRQVAVGLSTSYQGLTAKIYSDVVNMVFNASSSSMQKAKSYLLLNCILPLVVCLITSPLIRVMETPRSRRLSGGFLVIFAITMFTGAYAVITSLGSRTGLGPEPAVLIGMCVFLVAPLVVPLMEKLRERMDNKCLIRSYGKRVCDESSMGEENAGVVNEHGVKDEGLFVNDVEEIGVKVMIKRLNFWLYFFVYMFGATIGMVYLNNLGQIVESRGSSKTSSLVSLASSFGFFGRILPCLLDYHISRVKYKVSRPALISLMMVPMTASFFLLLNNNNLCLYISTATIGICTGAITSMSVSMTAELFGAKNFGVNHNIVVANIPIGSLLFGNMAALLYREQALANDNGKCMGIKCYQTSFIIWGSLCFLGTILAIILHSRSRKA